MDNTLAQHYIALGKILAIHNNTKTRYCCFLTGPGTTLELVDVSIGRSTLLRFDGPLEAATYLQRNLEQGSHNVIPLRRKAVLTIVKEK